MKLLVTGGAGFIGSNFIKLLLGKTEHEIINLDKITYAGKGKNIEYMGLDSHERYKFIKGDICDSQLVENIFKNFKPDSVVNFAAESHVDNSLKDDAPFMRTNHIGTGTLLCVFEKFGGEKFVQISTDEVYGSLEEKSPSSVETDNLNPRNPYSQSKANADKLVLDYFKNKGLPVCITRSSNNYGQYQFPEKVIPLFVTNLIEGKNVPLYGEGKNIRDWLHVSDNCKGILAVLENGEAGEIYNIGGGNEISNIGLTSRIFRRMKPEKGMIEKVKDRENHDFRYSLNCSKIEKELGWKPEINFNSGLNNTIEWYQKNENWWKRLK